MAFQPYLIPLYNNLLVGIVCICMSLSQTVTAHRGSMQQQQALFLTLAPFPQEWFATTLWHCPPSSSRKQLAVASECCTSCSGASVWGWPNQAVFGVNLQTSDRVLLHPDVSAGRVWPPTCKYAVCSSRSQLCSAVLAYACRWCAGLWFCTWLPDSKCCKQQTWTSTSTCGACHSG